MYQPRPFLGRGEIIQPSACRFVPRPSRGGAAKRWVSRRYALPCRPQGGRAAKRSALKKCFLLAAEESLHHTSMLRTKSFCFIQISAFAKETSALPFWRCSNSYLVLRPPS